MATSLSLAGSVRTVALVLAVLRYRRRLRRRDHWSRPRLQVHHEQALGAPQLVSNLRREAPVTEQPPSAGDREELARMDAANVRPRVPRWVKTLSIVVAVLLLLGVIVMLVSGGQHGPSRHRQASVGSPCTAVAGVSPAIGMR